MRHDRWWMLAHYYRRNGYVRVVNLARRDAEGSQRYKKGYEVRLVARDPDELEHIRSLLDACGYPVARPFVKAKQWVQPIYGRQYAEKFQALVKRRADRE